jgi:hypothetical protein
VNLKGVVSETFYKELEELAEKLSAQEEQDV